MKITKLLLLLTLLVFTACDPDEKDQWKEPVDVKFIFEVKTEPATDKDLKFTGGHLILTEFAFEGKRQQADDVHWYTSYDDGHKVVYDPNGAAEKMDFDLPQGNYTKIQIDFTADGKGSPAIVAEGLYTTKSGKTYPLIFELGVKEIYSLIAKNRDGNREVVLYKDQPATARVTFDPVFWFNHINSSQLDKAKISSVNGQETLLINENVNKEIYDKVYDKADKATEFVFEL